MTRRRAYGLRPRLLAALVFTAAVTLGVAALALLPPLQDRLTEQTATDLAHATDTDVPFFQAQIERAFKQAAHDKLTDRTEWLDTLQLPLANRALTLRDRTGARVIVLDSDPNAQPIADTDFAGSKVPEREAIRALIDGYGSTTRSGDQVIVTRTIFPKSFSKYQPNDAFVLVTEKQLTDVAKTVGQVRNAFLAAAAVGLFVAVLLGIFLATTLGRRLARLRAAAVRVAHEGTDAPTPRDDGLDEVGDLARALASMQRELRRQEAARRSFVATASHELRTPLTSLQGTIELLEDDLRDGALDQADAQRQVASARRELRRLASLATELLDLSRLDAAVPLREEPVELAELCRAVAAEFELRAREREVELDVTTPPGPCWGRGDPDAVARVIRILLDNALRHTPDSSTLQVVPAYHGDHATVAVADEGPGVAPQDHERIFERFERGSAPSGEGGFGLGLAIGRELARRMGGELRLDDAPRSGARFVLQLPIELPSGSHPEAETAQTAT
ncbi:MAG TPA: HAMP domain-containing sensor histidine kinase [Solirubrobacteraceae bacterium]|nr:HAMP domain-containing sensor histidine kinase [Solirubrobacteraceae bacterium]